MTKDQSGLYGFDEVRDYLVSQGFVCYYSYARPGCNWYACRAVKAQRPFELNGSTHQLVAYPYDMVGVAGIEIQFNGEFDGVWFSLKAYNISLNELKEKLETIEQSLKSAWNSLRPNLEPRETSVKAQWIPVETTEGMGSRVIVFSPEYRENDPMRYRIMDRQFLRLAKEVTHWQNLEPPLTGADALDELVREAQEMGMYDTKPSGESK